MRFHLRTKKKSGNSIERRSPKPALARARARALLYAWQVYPPFNAAHRVRRVMLLIYTLLSVPQ